MIVLLAYAYFIKVVMHWFFLINLFIFTIIIIKIKIGVITVKRHITMIWMGCYIRNKLLLLLLLLVCFIQ